MAPEAGRPLRAWLIDQGQHGHRVQSAGVLQALSAQLGPIETTTMRCGERVRGVFRPAARWMVKTLGRHGGRLAGAFSPTSPPPGPPPDLIVSSGGASAFASRALALATGAPNVFVGHPAPYPLDWFTCILAPRHRAEEPNLIETGYIPSTMTPAVCTAAARSRWGDAPPRAVWALLFGGRSRSHDWTDEDIAALAAAANQLAAARGIRWLVTTSRRTGAAADARLRDALDPAHVAELCLFSEKPEPVVPAYLGAASVAVVSQDSLTMLSECALSGLPTLAVAPATTAIDPTSDLAAVMTCYDATPGMRRGPAATLDHWADLDAVISTSPRDTIRARLDEAVARLATRLGMTR